MARMLERALTRVGPPALSLSDYRMLTAVADGEARASRLARRLAVGKPSVSASVDSLVRRGLLERRGRSTDQRAIELRITAAGDHLRRDAEAALCDLAGDVAAHTADPETTLAALAGFGAAIEERQREHAGQRAQTS
jgi:DNA-binding MarR family transcriptional regulator